MPAAWIRNLLWIDGTGGLVVGLAVLAVFRPLAELYGLPANLILTFAIANLTYGSAALLLARQRVRPAVLIAAMASANVAWGVVCGVTLALYARTTGVLGAAHLVVEGAYVVALGALEWRHRQTLRAR